MNRIEESKFVVINLTLKLMLVMIFLFLVGGCHWIKGGLKEKQAISVGMGKSLKGGPTHRSPVFIPDFSKNFIIQEDFILDEFVTQRKIKADQLIFNLRGNMLSDQMLKKLRFIEDIEKVIRLKGRVKEIHITQLKQVKNYSVMVESPPPGNWKKYINNLLKLGPVNKKFILPAEFNTQLMETVGKAGMVSWVYNMPNTNKELQRDIKVLSNFKKQGIWLKFTTLANRDLLPLINILKPRGIIVEVKSDRFSKEFNSFIANIKTGRIEFIINEDEMNIAKLESLGNFSQVALTIQMKSRQIDKNLEEILSAIISQSE